jgi:uncharacterized protein YciI
MFVVILTYIKPLEEIDILLAAHVSWLDEQYAAGYFLASGRRVPRTGGVILVRGLEREALDAILARDPFKLGGVADYQVVEFIPGKMASGLETLLTQ